MKILFLVFFLLILPNIVFAAEEYNTTLSDEIDIENTQNEIKIIEKTKKISDMTIQELEEIINTAGINVATSNYNIASLNTTFALSGIIIGSLLGFLSSLGVIVIKEKKTKNTIKNLLKNNLNRIRNNIKINQNKCKEMTANKDKRKAFLEKVKIHSAYLNELGISQRFNYWNVIMSSTYFIALNEKTIKYAQIAYDSVITYNDRIDHFVHGYQIKTMPVGTTSIREKLERDFRTGNSRTTETTFVQDCESMIKIQDQIIESLNDDLKMIE
ncbi:MAG: hypothetical protein HRO68_08035 [Nitrosopumilus sp.]|nr:hypothetical protein [Nitrosopumilus sp.]